MIFSQEMKQNTHSSNRECSQIVDMLQLESRRWLEGERFACRALAIPLEALPLHTHKHTCTHTDTHKLCFLVPSTWWKPQMSLMPGWLLQVALFKLRNKCCQGHCIMKVMYCIIHFPPVTVTPPRPTTDNHSKKLQQWRSVFLSLLWLCSILGEVPDCHSFVRFLQQPSSSLGNCKCTVKNK